MNIQKVLSNLAARRPIFHREDDFKFELAWEIRSTHNDASIRLEYPYRLFGIDGDQTRNNRNLDILVRNDHSSILIELKYLTRYFEGGHDGEVFQVRNHAAQNLRRYDVMKDISRIEQALERMNTTKENKHEANGFVIVLTNDPIYCNPPGPHAGYADFSLHQAREVEPGSLQWGGGVEAPGRGQEIAILGHYKFCWYPYSQIGEDDQGAFKALVVPITRNS